MRGRGKNWGGGSSGEGRRMVKDDRPDSQNYVGVVSGI